MSPMKIDHEAIRNLATLLTETDLTEIEIAEGDHRIRVTRALSVQAITAPTPMPMMTAANTPASASVPAPAADTLTNAIKSPMVGTVYLQPEPGAASFISKGVTVKPGDTLLIIEAMKVMNPIKAEKGGRVVDILVTDAQPVEFGQPLVVIE